MGRKIRFDRLSRGSCIVGRGTHDAVWERFFEGGEDASGRVLRVGFSDLVQEG
jgi:hypothetical protein